MNCKKIYKEKLIYYYKLMSWSRVPKDTVENYQDKDNNIIEDNVEDEDETLCYSSDDESTEREQDIVLTKTKSCIHDIIKDTDETYIMVSAFVLFVSFIIYYNI